MGKFFKWTFGLGFMFVGGVMLPFSIIAGGIFILIGVLIVK
jgi:hypothetical protein